MVRYETLFLTVPEITTDEAATLEKQFDKVVSAAEGTVIAYERWGKYRLAYPVRRNEYGVYYLARFEVDDKHKDSLLDALKNFFQVKFGEIIMRNTVVRLDPLGSLDYKRPESLEEVPTKDIDAFVKESKSLLSSTSAAPEELLTDEMM
jgi:small subunit ribosomal protein S6